jgi:abhydrolase domain-containing protein 14
MRRTAPVLLGVLVVAGMVAGLGGCTSDDGPAAGETTIEVDGTPVHAIVRQGPRRPGAVATVLFLHGQSYTSRIWDQRGIIDAVADTGHRAVAVDLPGYGDTPERPGGADDAAAFLDALIDELGGPGEVVLVSPSRSGEWSLSYLAVHPEDELLGFVPVAPVGIDDFARTDGAAMVPTVSVWGSEDGGYTPERAQHLVDEMGGEPTARTEIIEGASHAAYDDHPEEFLALLLPLLPTA